MTLLETRATAETDIDSAAMEAIASKCDTEYDPFPIGTVLRRLRGDMSLRDLQNETGIANAYLSMVETGAKRPGVKVLQKLAKYYDVPAVDLYRCAGLLNDEDERPDAGAAAIRDIERSYRFLMDDPRLMTCAKPEVDPSLAVKRFLVEMYEHISGKRLL